MNPRKTLKWILYVLLLSAFSFFTACAPAVLGSAGATGYKTAVDERSVGTMVDDAVISSKVKTNLIADEFVKSRYIDVDVLNGVVYLIGVVESSSQKRMAADIARGVEGVRAVQNQLTVGKTSAGHIMDDAILTSKIKTQLIKTENVHSGNIDVDTVNGVVSLTGIVGSESEKNNILYVTRQVAGNRTIVDNIRIGK